MSNNDNRYVQPALSRGWVALIVILAVVLADQVLKFWVKTHMFMGEEISVLPWFKIKFIENNGMAFGWHLGSKIFLTLGRVVLVGLLIWLLVKIKGVGKLRTGYIISIALIVAGAAGNIFDCVFYGEIFSDPNPPAVAALFPYGGGYAPWFEGRVVDMLYFPFFTFTWPGWVPVVGGTEYEFFQYIFNIADASICVGVFLLILFYSRDVSETFNIFSKKKVNEKAA